MSMKINANIPALMASRHINKTNDKITTALEKLSSGYKINSVSDDPAGTAVANKIKAQLYGLKKANQNSMDGVSLVQTAEGAMSEVHEMLQRMRELAVQASNDTNMPDDRQKMQMEIDQLIESIDQMADVTEFNQLKLLNGSLSNLTTVSQDEEISRDISVKYMSPNFPVGEYNIELGEGFSCALVEGEYIYVTGRIELNGDYVDILDTDSDSDVQRKITDLAERYDCIAAFDTWPKFSIMAKEAGSKVSLELKGDCIEDPAGGDLPIMGQGTDAKFADSDLTTYGFSTAATYRSEGNRIIISESGGTTLQIDLNVNKDYSDTTVDGEYTLKIEDKGQLKLQTGANEDQRVALMIPGLSSYSLGLKKQSFAVRDEGNTVNLVNVKNKEGAQRSIALLDEGISKVSTMRSTLGAYQNRLEHTVRSLDSNEANTEESLSRIQDTDMALEMSSYTLNNVIMQSAIAMLSQANERPQQLLQLLR